MRKPPGIPNELFAYERKKRHWTQGDVADKISAPDERLIRRWERGEVAPTPHYRGKLAEVFGKSARELGFPPDGQISFWHMPYRRNTFFTGREDILQLLDDTFLAQHSSPVPRLPLSLSGLGGMGKTQIALEYAYRYREHYHTVLWLHAASYQNLIGDVTAVAYLLDLPGKVAAKPVQRIEALKEWLTQLSRWLLIFDNVEDFQLLEDFLPSEIKGHLLLTTLSQNTGTHAHRIAVEPMDNNSGAELLLRRSKLLARESTLEHMVAADAALARSLSEDMEGLPLALDQTGAYIEETDASLSEFVQLYQQERDSLLNRRGAVASKDGGHPQSVATTFELSFAKAREQYPLADDILHFCAFLHPDAIPEELFQHDDHFRYGTTVFKEAIAALRRYSLITRHTQEQTFSMHRLVQAVFIDGMPADIQKQWRERVVQAVNEHLPEIYNDNEKQCGRLLPHAFVCATWKDDELTPILDVAELFHKVGDYLRRQGRPTVAETLLTRALSFYKQHLRIVPLDAPVEIVMATALDDLAGVYIQLGKFSQMEPLLQQALTTQEKHFGTNHRYTLPSLELLAELYVRQCKYAQAEVFLVRALFIYIGSFGLKHRYTIIHLRQLADFYSTRRAYELAAFFYRKTLKILEKRLGAEHPEMLNTLFELARLLAIQGKHDQAEAFYRRAVSIQEQQVWKPHLLIWALYILPEAARKDYASFLHYIGCDAEAPALATDDEPSGQGMEPYSPHSTSISWLRLALDVIVPH